MLRGGAASAGTSPASAGRRRRPRRASRGCDCWTHGARALPLSPVRRQLLIKDLKIFLRDVSQWSQLLLLLALVLVYLYNFRVLDLAAHPVHERLHQERLRVREPRHGRAS